MGRESGPLLHTNLLEASGSAMAGGYKLSERDVWSGLAWPGLATSPFGDLHRRKIGNNVPGSARNPFGVLPALEEQEISPAPTPRRTKPGGVARGGAASLGLRGGYAPAAPGALPNSDAKVEARRWGSQQTQGACRGGGGERRLSFFVGFV